MEDGRRGGLTLEALAERLGALERENGRMRSENAELRGKVAALEGGATNGATGGASETTARGLGPSDGGKVSRRALLGKAGAAAVAATAAGSLLTPREARAATVEGTGAPGVRGVNTGEGRAERGQAAVVGVIQEGLVGDGVAGLGRGLGYVGVYGETTSSGGGSYGVYGYSRSSGFGGAGVAGFSDGGTGVYAITRGDGSSAVDGLVSAVATAGNGVRGTGRGESYYGVLGLNDTGTGVQGESKQADLFGVAGRNTGDSGSGVLGEGRGRGKAGVLGRNADAGGVGVQAQGATGIDAEGAGGYGGQFRGGRAQLRLVPGATPGSPTTGTRAKGEIYMDRAATLWVCTMGGTPGTWVRLTTA